jgi:hypothetical protein
MLIRRLDDLGVADRAARLNDRAHARLRSLSTLSRKGKKGVGGEIEALSDDATWRRRGARSRRATSAPRRANVTRRSVITIAFDFTHFTRARRRAGLRDQPPEGVSRVTVFSLAAHGSRSRAITARAHNAASKTHRRLGRKAHGASRRRFFYFAQCNSERPARIPAPGSLRVRFATARRLRGPRAG